MRLHFYSRSDNATGVDAADSVVFMAREGCREGTVELAVDPLSASHKDLLPGLDSHGRVSIVCSFPATYTTAISSQTNPSSSKSKSALVRTTIQKHGYHRPLGR